MNNQMFDIYRKVSESWVEMQQQLFQGAPSFPYTAPQGAAGAPEWARDAQKKWIAFAAEILDRHRESMDGLYKSAIHLFQETSQLPETKSSDGPPLPSGTNGTKASKVGQGAGSATARHLRRSSGRRK
jgi:hypothetical protein